MPKQTEGLADEWQRLLTEWESAMAAYQAAVAAGSASADDSGIEAAKDRLGAIKAKMDGIIAAGKAERQSRGRKEDLVARVIDLDDPERPGGAGSDRTRGG